MERDRGFFNPDGTFHKVEPPITIKDSLIKERGQKTVQELSDKLEVGMDMVEEVIDSLIDEGYGFKRIDGVVVRTKTAEPKGGYDASEGIGPHFKFGIVSDSHLASKHERLDALESLYDIFENEGVKVVLHTGDITEGVGVFRGQEYEVHKYGQHQQINYAVQVYPKREGITTHFITGNHDLRGYERGGVDPGVSIANRRPDMHYLGQAQAKIIAANGADIDMLHPAGGTAYALSYKGQRYINNLNPEDVPEMMVWGHYHNAYYMHYRNVHFIQAACTKGAGVWEKRMGLNPTIGGWLVEGHISDNGRIDRFKPELFRFQGTEKR